MARYRPQPFNGDELPEIRRYLEAELVRISQTFDTIANGEQEITNAAPTKMTVADIKFADGTGWNPGSGMGLYIHSFPCH